MNPRRTAFEVLRQVADGGYSNLLLPKALRELPTVDRGLATELTYGTLRRQGSIDAVLAACLTSGWPKPKSLTLLRLGAYQLLFTRIPAHAAVSETVQLAREVHEGTALINAVLRKVAAADWDSWLKRLSHGLSDLDQLALEYSYPRWVVDELATAYGREELVEVLAAGNAAPEVTLVARRCAVDELLAVPGAQPGRWSELAVRLASGNPGDVAQVRDHRAGVQDEGSQLVALLLNQIPVAGPQRQWLDLCAGPGGKAALLERFASAHGARLLAIEPSPARAELVRQSLVKSEVRCADARNTPLPTADRVLVDAPCTGIGALRRRPESRWRRSPADIPDLTRLQGELLQAASRAVRPGGVIVYSTCSPVRAETDEVVAAFLARNANFVELELTELLPQLALPSGTTRLRLSPAKHGTDGMFAVALRRAA